MAHLNYQKFETEDGAKVAINPNSVSYVEQVDEEKTKVVFSDPELSDIYVQREFNKTISKLTTNYV